MKDGLALLIVGADLKFLCACVGAVEGYLCVLLGIKPHVLGKYCLSVLYC